MASQKKPAGQGASIALWIIGGIAALIGFVPGGFPFIIIGAIIILLGFLVRNSAKKRQTAKEDAAARAEGARLYAEKHGKLYCKVAGVTFDNDDGSSRQRILRAIARDPDSAGDVTLQRYEYNGKPAIYVLCGGKCVGNVTEDDLPAVLPILDRIEYVDIDVEDFASDVDDGGEKIYRADLTIQYAK